MPTVKFRHDKSISYHIVWDSLVECYSSTQNNTNQNPDRWSGVRPAAVCVLIVLEVLKAVVQSI